MIYQSTKKLLFVFAALSLLVLISVSFAPNENMLVSARKQSDILFLKGKFILKDKRGSIVISDDKKCPCYGHYK